MDQLKQELINFKNICAEKEKEIEALKQKLSEAASQSTKTNQLIYERDEALDRMHRDVTKLF
jgi:hypothetical protein